MASAVTCWLFVSAVDPSYLSTPFSDMEVMLKGPVQLLWSFPPFRPSFLLLAFSTSSPTLKVNVFTFFFVAVIGFFLPVLGKQDVFRESERKKIKSIVPFSKCGEFKINVAPGCLKLPDDCDLRCTYTCYHHLFMWIAWLLNTPWRPFPPSHFPHEERFPHLAVCC